MMDGAEDSGELDSHAGERSDASGVAPEDGDHDELPGSGADNDLDFEDDEEEVFPKWLVEHAVSSRSTCRSCAGKIQVRTCVCGGGAWGSLGSTRLLCTRIHCRA